jgi:hypothetical protein
MSSRATQLIEAGLWLKMSGDVEGARRLFEQALRLDPESGRALELLGQAPGQAEPVPEELRDVPQSNTDLFTVPLPRLFPDEPPPPASVPEDWWAPPESAPPVPAAASGFMTTEGVMIAPKAGSTAVWPAPAEADFGAARADEFNLTLDWSPSPAIERTPTPLRGAPAPERRERTPGPRGGIVAPERKERTPVPHGAVGAVPLPSSGAPERRERTPGPRGGFAPVPLASSDVPERRERTPGPHGGIASVPMPSSDVPERRERTPGPPGGIASVPRPSSEVPERRERTPALHRGTAAAPPPEVPERRDRAPRSPGGLPAVPLPSPRDAWGGSDDVPTQLGLEEGGGDALELVTELRPATGLTPLPAPRDTRAEAVRLLERARELQGLDDHSGARELLLRTQALHPELSGLADALLRSEAKLQIIYESKIGKLGAVPRVRLREDEVIWLNLDHRAGFMLAQIDGTLTFEDLFSVSGMSRLDTARILAQLLEQRVIIS